jgi:hypothetical protein
VGELKDSFKPQSNTDLLEALSDHGNRLVEAYKEVKVLGGNASGSQALLNQAGTIINPATDEGLDDIVTAIQNISIPAPTGGATEVNQTNGTQKTQIVDAGGEVATITGGKLDVNAAIDTTGLATSTKQDTIIGHVDGIEALLTTIESNQLPDSHNVTVDNTSIAVTGTFWQANQPVTGTFSAVSATTVDATASGDNTIVSITNSPRLYYIALSANGANSADVTAIVKIGASSKFKVSLKAGAMWAHHIGASMQYLTGSVGDDIVVNLSANQTVHVSVEYADV